MINSRTKQLGLAMLCIITSFTLYAQNKTVILYNLEPIQVQLEGDNIIQFIGVQSDYMDGYDLTDNRLVAVTPLKSIDSEVSKSSSNGMYSIVSKERIFLEFSPSNSILDRNSILELNKIAARLISDNSLNLLIASHTEMGKKSSDKLAANRLKAVKAYLKIKGIHKDRIQEETLVGQSLLDKVAINYLM